MTEADIRDLIQQGRLKIPPLQVVDVELEPWNPGGRVDALLTLAWRDRNYRFVAETRRLWTPKAIAEATDQVRRYAISSDTYPLVIVPYLDEEQLITLEAQDVSGIDLCGNGIVIVPNELLVFRTGFPNRFRREGTIKNVYGKNSSIVARAFLLVPEFGSVNEALEEIRRRGGEVTLATVSKVCKGLDTDLVIERGRGQVPVARRLRLLQSEKLLDLLVRNYKPPLVSRRFRGKCALEPQELTRQLTTWAERTGGRVVLTGASSVEAYAVMAREPAQSFYCSDIEGIITSLRDDVRETDRFANVELLETRDQFVYFDRRPGLAASPIQSYLELVSGEKREQQTAEQVRRVILGPPVQDSRNG